MKNFRVFGLAVFIASTSCFDQGVSVEEKAGNNEGKSVHDGDVTLMISDADLIQVDSNPQYNTAEWYVRVKNPGRYEIWLSSMTCDTSRFRFKNDVIITIGDSRIEKKPVGDKIVTNDPNIKKPWFRADSHMGSVYFNEPGEYQVQVISNGVVPHSSGPLSLRADKHDFINSLDLRLMDY